MENTKILNEEAQQDVLSRQDQVQETAEETAQLGEANFQEEENETNQNVDESQGIADEVVNDQHVIVNDETHESEENIYKKFSVDYAESELLRHWSPSPEKKMQEKPLTDHQKALNKDEKSASVVEPEEFGSYDQTPIRLSKRQTEMLRKKISNPKLNQQVMQVDLGCFSSTNSPQ